jgi:tetratricopeptide (TPR) repeat protein
MGRARPDRRQQRPRSSRSGPLLPLSPGWLIFGLAAGVYLNALGNPFVYDDFFTVLNNPSIADPSNVAWILQYTRFRPVVNVSYAVDRLVWGTRPLGYHLTSILLHAVMSVLVYHLLRRALNDGVATREVDSPEVRRYERWTAFGAAALFAVHPMMTESVGYISGRSEVLCGIFMLGALLLARGAIRAGTASGARPGTGRWLKAAGALACAGLALLSKEVAAALPVLFVAYELLLLRHGRAGRRRILAIGVPALFVIALGAAYRIRSLASHDAMLSAEPGYDLLTQSIVVWRYLRLLVLPIGQSIMHDVHRVSTLTDPYAIAAVAAWLGVAVTAFLVRRRAPVVTFGVVWFAAAIAPSSSIVRLQEGMAEHRVYIASVGLFLVTGALVMRTAPRAGAAPVHVARRFAPALVALILSLGILTTWRNELWMRPVDVWAEAVEHAPASWQSHYALGDAQREAGDCESALVSYRRSLELRQPNPRVLLNLGICQGELGQLDAAEATFSAVLVQDPASAKGYTNLAAVELLRERRAQARALYHRALEIEPDNVPARIQLARIAEERDGDYAEAVRLCSEVRRLQPQLQWAADCVARNEGRLRGERSEP